jgi:hypothetical protein
MEKAGYEKRLKERADEIMEKQQKAVDIARVSIQFTHQYQRKKQFLAYKEMN